MTWSSCTLGNTICSSLGRTFLCLGQKRFVEVLAFGSFVAVDCSCIHGLTGLRAQSRLAVLGHVLISGLSGVGVLS